MTTTDESLSAAPAIALLKRLIAAGRDGEAAVQRIVADELARLGAAVEAVRYAPSAVRLKTEFATAHAADAEPRDAIVGRIAGSGGGASLILFAHPDSEPLSGLDRWRNPPFEARIVGGRLHGWGVADDLAGVAAMLAGVSAALEQGARPRGDVIVASTPSKRHARGVAALLERLPRPDAAVYLHPAESGGGMAEAKACTCGLLEFRLAAAGRRPDTQEPCHTTFAHKAESAVAVAAAAIARLQALDAERGRRVRHARIEEAVGRATNILFGAIAGGAPGVGARVAESCIIHGTVSFPPGEDIAAVQREVEAAAEGPGISFEWLSGVPGAEIAADHPLFLALSAAVKAEVGAGPSVNPLHTASDIRVPIVQHGIPTVGFGPLCGGLSQNGGHDEWVDAADYLRCCGVVARLIRGWCG